AGIGRRPSRETDGAFDVGRSQRQQQEQREHAAHAPSILAGMSIDVAAPVVANRALSADYNVLALAAPAIAAAAAPGQVVMVKPLAGFAPLLRRPFSVFEILRDQAGAPTGFSILSKRIGPSTRLLYDARPGDPVAVLGPLGRPFTVVEPPVDAWMIAG